MSKAIAVIDTRALDVLSGAELVRNLESRNIDLVFVSEDVKDRALDEALAEHPNSALISKTSAVTTSGEFWSSVFDVLDNGRNQIVAVVGTYEFWTVFNYADKHRVPFRAVVDKTSSRRATWL